MTLLEYKDELTDFQNEVLTKLDSLFETAFKGGYDFKFIQVLFGAGVMGMNIHQSMRETMMLVSNMRKFISDKNYKDDNFRIGLMIYCHISEADFIPRILHNLLSVKDGDYNAFPFPRRGNLESSPKKKIEQLKEKDEELGVLLEKIYNSDLRNAFFHSDYVLTVDGIAINVFRNMRQQTILYSELEDILQKMLFFFDCFMETWLAYKSEIYKKGDVIKGDDPFNNWELIFEESNNQVIGFKSTYEKPVGDYLNRNIKNNE